MQALDNVITAANDVIKAATRLKDNQDAPADYRELLNVKLLYAIERVGSMEIEVYELSDTLAGQVEARGDRALWGCLPDVEPSNTPNKH